jgi:hypothetical protein
VNSHKKAPPDSDSPRNENTCQTKKMHHTSKVFSFFVDEVFVGFEEGDNNAIN